MVYDNKWIINNSIYVDDNVVDYYYLLVSDGGGVS